MAVMVTSEVPIPNPNNGNIFHFIIFVFVFFLPRTRPFFFCFLCFFLFLLSPFPFLWPDLVDFELAFAASGSCIFFPAAGLFVEYCGFFAACFVLNLGTICMSFLSLFKSPLKVLGNKDILGNVGGNKGPTKNFQGGNPCRPTEPSPIFA